MIATFAELEALEEGRSVEGWVLRSLYDDYYGRPMGARFEHPNGMAADVLRFASVPQISVNFGTLPTSDKGESHTLEHLVLGKGRKGKYFNSLLSMSLGSRTAGTYSELTNYQCFSAAGKEPFYRLLRACFSTLIKPDFTDEEIRREMANLEVVRDPAAGRLRLEEKGTVYVEMVSSMEKAAQTNWYRLAPLVYGRKNPLALNQGGDPAWIRKCTVEDLRAYHAANYHFGSNCRVVAALPGGYSPAEFLSRLNAVMDEVEPEARKARRGRRPVPGNGRPGPPYAALPPFRPAAGSPIVIGRFPSEDPNLPQSVFLAFRPLKRAPDPLEEMRVEIFLAVLGDGDTSFLYKDLVDEERRVFDTGASNVSAELEEDPANVPMLFLSGMPQSRLEKAHLAKVRRAVMDRIRSIGEAGKGSELLAEFNAKALSLLSSWRRSTLKFINSPPRFGFRNSGAAWHKHLASLDRMKGLRKPAAFTPCFDALEAELLKGGSPWKRVIRRAGLDRAPVMSAVRSDRRLLEKQKAERAKRLEGHVERLKKKYRTRDGQEALARFQEETLRRTAEIKDLEASIERPSFVDDPPMELDTTIDWELRDLTGPVRAAVSRFPSTPFTDVRLYFSLRGARREELPCLPVAAALLTDLGVTTRSGEKLDYVRMPERWRSEIYSLGAGITAFAKRGRYELAVSASGSGPGENLKAVEWLENCLLRADVSPGTVVRLRTAIKERIRTLRQIFQLREEYWVRGAANAYVYRADPLWMSTESPFTELQHICRLFFRLGALESPEARTSLRETFDVLKGHAGRGGRRKLEEGLRRMSKGRGILAEAGEYLAAELCQLPDACWREDMRRLLDQTLSDIEASPGDEMARMKAFLRRVLVRSGVRVSVTGSPENTEAVLPAVRALLEKLPMGERTEGSHADESPVLARLKERLRGLRKAPVHVGLVNNNTKSGVFVASADGPSYDDPSEEAALDALAGEIFSGYGPHTFFLQTWAAGLAYSNGIRPALARGRFYYYAERCPDLTATMRFVTALAEKTELSDRFFLDFALSNAFSDHRGAEDFSSRGSMMAADLADGQGPEKVRAFREALLRAAGKPDALERIRSRVPALLGRVLVGLGPRMKDIPSAVGFVTGPDAILDRYDAFLKENGEGGLTKIFPRDFWLFD